MNIRIVGRPSGDAPEHIRDAWIGLSLPLHPDYPGVEKGRGISVLGPKTWFAMLWKSITGRGPRRRGYAVDPAAAVSVLQMANPEAAAWWRTNVPQMFTHKRALFFDETCCRPVEDEPAAH